MKGRRAPRTNMLFVGMLLFQGVGGLCDDPAAFRFKERLYDGKLYRQFWRKGFESFGRFQTFMRVPSGQLGIPDKWEDIGGDRDLGDAINSRGMEVDEGIVTALPAFKIEAPGRPGAERPVRRRVYLLDIAGTDRVVAADPLAGGTLAIVNLPQGGPVALRLSPDRTKLYVAHRAQQEFGTIPELPAALIVMDADPLRIARRYDLPPEVVPRLRDRSLEVTPDGHCLYLVNEGRFEAATGGFMDSSIVRLDAATGEILGEIPMPRAGQTFDSLRISPDGAVLYALASSRLYVIDVLTHTISLEVAPIAGNFMEIHPNGSTLFIAQRPGANPGGVRLFDTVSATLGELIPIEGAVEIEQIVVSADGLDLFVNDDLGEAIHHIYLPEMRVVDRLSVPRAGSVIAMGR